MTHTVMQLWQCQAPERSHWHCQYGIVSTTGIAGTDIVVTPIIVRLLNNQVSD